MLKDKLKKIKDGIKTAKSQATHIGQNAAKTAGAVTEIVKTGVSTSKGLFEKGREVQKKFLTKKNIQQGLEVTSKGVEIAAKGAKTVAETMEKASKNIRNMGDKLGN